MSLKPLKKSDIEKPWMKLRDRRIRLSPEYHLIVAEGKETEPNYFKGLKDEINLKFPNRVEIAIEGCGGDPLSLLNQAKKIVSKDQNPIKHVWLAYDKDDIEDDKFDNTAAECKSISNEDITYHALWSNECIELWFLLHFEYMHSAMRRNDYYTKLSAYLKFEYKKNSKKMYENFRGSVQTAIVNAKKLQNEMHCNKSPSQCSPGTNVYEIFEFFKNEKYIEI